MNDDEELVNGNEEEEEEDGTIVLSDDEGNEVNFEFLDSIELNDNEYVVLLPKEETENASANEVVILKVEVDENDEESYVSIEDETELDQVFEEFKARYQDEFDFED